MKQRKDRGIYFAIILVVSILVYLWPVQYLFGPQRWLGAVLIFFNLGLCFEYNRRYSSSLRDWGFSVRHFLPALILILLFTAPAAGVLYWAGKTLGTLSWRPDVGRTLAGLFLWALAQQFALQTVLLREMRKGLTARWGILAAALVFALLHLPNPFLTAVTFLGGWVWCCIYSRHPNLIPVALSHALCSLFTLGSLSRDITGGMRVGYSYFLLGS